MVMRQAERRKTVCQTMVVQGADGSHWEIKKCDWDDPLDVVLADGGGWHAWLRKSELKAGMATQR